MSQAVDFLKDAWPEELANLTWKVLDAPLSLGSSGEVDRFRVNRNTMQIVLYRLPIERLTHHRRTDRLDERFHIEQYVFLAAAELIGKDPDDLIPDNFRD